MTRTADLHQLRVAADAGLPGAVRLEKAVLGPPLDVEFVDVSTVPDPMQEDQDAGSAAHPVLIYRHARVDPVIHKVLPVCPTVCVCAAP